MDLKFDYDDILIQPATVTHIDSRSEINLYDENNMLPLFTAPMLDVVDKDNIDIYFKNKIYGIYPRTNWNKQYFFNGSGLKFSAHSMDEFEYWLLNNEMQTPTASILIDIANGHMSKLITLIRTAKKKYGNRLTLMVGNIANPETYRILSDNGADFIRLGIGNGNACHIKGSKIKTKNGIKNIEDIIVGDYVLTHLGTYEKVTLKHILKADNLIKINNNISTPNHEYYVLNKKYKNVVNDDNIHEYAEWLSLDKINKDYFLIEIDENV